MDQMQYKLRSKDPVLVSHAISKLLLRVKEAYTKQIDISNAKSLQISEYKLLLSMCNSDDVVLCASTCQALVLLAEHGLIPVTLAITNITSYLSSIKHYSTVVKAVSHLLMLELKSCIDTNNLSCPYSFSNHQHPFITILIHDNYCWRNILDHMKAMLNDSDVLIARNSVEFFRPVFVYIMCNPSNSLDNCKERTWYLLNNIRYGRQLQLDILVWFCTNNAKSCVETNQRILELAEVSLHNEDAEFCAAILPLIASLAIQLLEYGHNPTFNFDTIAKIVKYCSNAIGNITLHLITEVIAICPAIYLSNVLNLCNKLMDVIKCNHVSSRALFASLLKWIAYPSLLSSSSSEAVETLARTIVSKKIEPCESMANNSIIDSICHADTYIEFYCEMYRCTNTWTGLNTLLWLNNISMAPIDVKYKCRFILSGHFLGSDDAKVIAASIDILTQIAKEVNSCASMVLCLILYKLTMARDAKETAFLSLTLPKLLVSKENVPIVIHTFDAFRSSSCDTLKLLSIKLYLKALESDPRCYRFLSGALVRALKMDRTWLSRTTCAKVIRDICRSRPEHGEDLVPMISQILNESSSVDGSAATAFAIEGISELCRAAVIGICSTWRVLAPMADRETRPIVLIAFCKLFREIPSFPGQSSDDHETLIVDVVTRLWAFVASSNDLEVIRCALRALTSYHFDTMPLKTIPAEWQDDIVLNKSYVKSNDGEDARPDNTLPYVPGVCWIEMMRKINPNVLSLAGDLLISFIEQELSGFRSGIYIWPQGEPQNFKYLPEKSVIRAIGDHLRRYDKSRSNDERITLECLRIFAHEYTKPLPNVRWDFLHSLSAISPASKTYSLLIACHNATTSESAKRFIEEHLLLYKNESQLHSVFHTEEFLILYSRLRHLCTAIQSDSFKTFLEVTFNYVTKRLLIGNENASNTFVDIMSSYAKALKNNTIQNDNLGSLSSNLEQLLDKIDVESKCGSAYIAAVLEMPVNDATRITRPITWQMISDKKLQNAIILRTNLVLYNNLEAPLSFLKEFIDLGATTPGIHECLLESIQKIQSQMHSHDLVPSWTLDFIAHIQDSMKEISDKQDNAISFYCDVLLVCIISLSGLDKVVKLKSLTASSPDIRCRLLPLSTRILANRQLWKTKIPQVMEWLSSMGSYGIPKTYKVTFYNSLISLKNEPSYRYKWTVYLSAKDCKCDNFNI